MCDKPTLVYWDIRGTAQATRNLLHYAGVDYQEKLYQFGPGKSMAEMDSIRQHWYKDKYTLDLDFPNLPYLIDGDVKLTQSTAILKYLARKHGLIASDMVTLAKQEMLDQQLHDIMMPFIMMLLFSGEQYPAKKEEYLKYTLPGQFESLEKFLGDNQWLTKDISYVDFLATETLDWLRLFSPSTFANYPKLTAYLDRFESLPAIKKYHSSSEYKSWPLFSPFAPWGYWK